MKTLLLGLALLPACNLDFDHGASSDPAGGSGSAAHVVRGQLVEVLAPTGAASARLADIDGDGALDLVYMGSDSFVFQPGDGHGNFAAATMGPAITGATQLGFGDYDGDGIVDFVTGAGDQVTLWRGGGAGHLTSMSSYTSTAPLAGVAVIDTGSQGVHRGLQILSASGSGYEVYGTYTGSDDPYPLYALDGDSTAGAATSLNIAPLFSDVPFCGFMARHKLITPPPKTLPSCIDITDQEGITSWGGGSCYPGSEVGLTDGAVFTAGTAAAIAGDGALYEKIYARNSPAGITTLGDTHHNTAAGLLPPIDFVDVGDLDGDGIADVLGGSLSNRELVVMSGGAEPGSLVLDATFPLPSDITAMHVDGDVNGDGIADPVITLADRVTILMSGD